MPPKPRYSRDQIAEAALDLVREKGLEALTARELASRIGSSTQPIFTAFRDMDELREVVRIKAEALLESYTLEALRYTSALKQAGKQIIAFAKEEPKLFQLIYMSERDEAMDFLDLFSEHMGYAEELIAVIRHDYGLCEEDARALFQHTWIYNYGIGVLCATGACTFTDDEINDMLGIAFYAVMGLIKSGRLHEPTPVPHLVDE